MNDPQFKEPGRKLGGKSLLDILQQLLTGDHLKVSGASGPDSGANYTEAMTGSRYQ